MAGPHPEFPTEQQALAGCEDSCRQVSQGLLQHGESHWSGRQGAEVTPGVVPCGRSDHSVERADPVLSGVTRGPQGRVLPSAPAGAGDPAPVT